MDRPGGHDPDPAAEQAVERLAAEHGVALLGLAVSLVDDRQAAEEVVQDALYQAYRHIRSGRPVTRVSWVLWEGIQAGWQRGMGTVSVNLVYAPSGSAFPRTLTVWLHRTGGP